MDFKIKTNKKMEFHCCILFGLMKTIDPLVCPNIRILQSWTI